MHLLIGLVAGLTAFANKAMADSTLPLAATDSALKWDDLYHFLVWLSVVFFVLVVGAMLYFIVKFRSGKNPRTKFITGNHTLEAVWIAIPTVLLMVIFGWGYWVYRDMVQAPPDAYEIRIVAKQWSWTFLYDSHEPTTGVLYIPINRPVKMVMTSEDVLHSFFIPNFRVKQDVVPGMFTSVWFEARVPGVHQIFCAEYCGGSHSGMLAQAVALTDEQWKAFTQGATPDPASFPVAGQPGPETVVGSPPAADAVKTAQSAPEPAAASKPLTMAQKGRVVFEQKGCV